MQIIKEASLNADQKQEIVRLWNEEYPVQMSYAKMADFDQYLDNLANKQHLLLVDDSGRISGWAMLFDRDGERWFAIILHTDMQGKGYGTKMLNIIKEGNDKLSGWVIDHNDDLKANGLPYKSPLGFYTRNGFTTCPQVRLELEKISAVRIEWQAKA